MPYVNKKLISLTILIIIIGAAPPILFVLSPIKSFSAGCLITACLGILFSLHRIKTCTRIKRKTLVFFLFSVLYIIAQHSLVGPWQEKSYSSIIPLTIITISAYLLSQELIHLNNKLVLRAFTWSFYSFTLVGLLNIATSYSIGKSLGYTHAQSVFPFLEPSHYALYFGPLAFIYIVTQKNIVSKIGGIGLIAAMSMVIPNTTLLTYACLSILTLVFNFRPKVIFLVLPVFLAITAYGTNAVLSNEYFSKRLNVSSESTQNTTTLVYLQGLQDAKNALSTTNGLGLGFQMLGTQPPSDYSYSIAKIMSDVNGELNRQDGGFLAAKMVSEFGIVGLCAVILFGILSVQAFLRIRKLTKDNADNSKTKLIIFNCIIATFCIEMFVRGYGYFSPGLYLLLTSLFYVEQVRITHKRNNRQFKHDKNFQKPKNLEQPEAAQSIVYKSRSKIIEAQ